MGGGGGDVDGNSGAAGFDSPSDIGPRTRTVVLVGRTGNGKSATANSIVGRTSFTSRPSSAGVTYQCQLESTRLKDGQKLDVIDTPGIFDLRGQTDIEDRIIECVRFAKDGIHAVLLVFSARARFSEEEEFALRCLHDLFGEKVIDYVIVVFTGGDELEEAGVTLEQFLGSECPDGLKHILELCENRRVLFDNKTKVEVKKAKQLQELLGLIDAVVAKNGGQAYTQGLIAELLKKREVEDKLQMKFVKQICQHTETVAARIKESISRLEKQLAEEKAARLEAEKNAQAAQEKSNDEIRKLRKDLEKAQKDGCAIL